MKGYYEQDVIKKNEKIPTGKLRIDITNLPELKELIERAQKEAEKLQETIKRLHYFELCIEFNVDGADDVISSE